MQSDIRIIVLDKVATPVRKTSASEADVEVLPELVEGVRVTAAAHTRAEDNVQWAAVRVLLQHGGQMAVGDRHGGGGKLQGVESSGDATKLPEQMTITDTITLSSNVVA